MNAPNPGTGTAAKAADTDALINRWKAADTTVEQVAAKLAAKLTAGQMGSWEELPSLADLAGEYDVSQRTISRAKRLLAHHGFLVVADGRYYVA